MRFAAVSLAAGSLLAATPLLAAECKQTGELSGRATTVNQSDALQYGTAEITIVREGRTFFSGKGVMVGQVVGTQENTLPIINHTIYFANGVRLQTDGDVVEQLTPTGKFESGVPCEFYAVERITSAKANKMLTQLSNDNHNVEATGTVSYCSDDNRNVLEFSGAVCFD